MSDNILPFATKPEPPRIEPAGDPLDRALAMQEILAAQLLKLAAAVDADRVLILQQAAAIDVLTARVGLLEQAVIMAGGIATTALARCPEPVIQ